MVKIAICDDDLKLVSSLESMIWDIATQAVIKVDIEVFYDGEEIYQNINDSVNYYDIIFLDVQMDKMGGKEFGDKLRNELCDEQTKIIFISSEKSFAHDLYGYRPHNFLVKPLSRELVEPSFLKAVELLNRDKVYYKYKIGYDTFKIDIAEILYFTIREKNVAIHCVDDREILFIHKIGTVYEELKDCAFFFIHKSYLVNYGNVKSMKRRSVTMKNGDVLPVSEKYRGDIKNLLLNDLVADREE